MEIEKETRFGHWETSDDEDYYFIYDYKVESLVLPIEYSVEVVSGTYDGKKEWAIKTDFSHDISFGNASITLCDEAYSRSFSDPAEAIALVNAEIEKEVKSAAYAVQELRI